MAFLKQLKIVAPLVISKALKSDSPQRKRVNNFLVRQMGESKGLWLKVGQMLAIHPETWEGLENLPDSESIPSLAQEEMDPYIEKLFEAEGKVWSQEIKEILYPGLAASLSQVHRVTLKDDSSWMIKFKLPGIKDVIEDQLSLFGLLNQTQKVTTEKKSFSMTDYQKTLQHSFEVELDYEMERKNIKFMEALKERFPQTCEIAKLHPTLQGQDFITMSEVTGDSWKFVLDNYSQEEKKLLGHELFRQVLFQYFCRGHCQGDFHPGNFFFKRQNAKITIGWIDLGQCLTPSPVERRALFLAINSLITSDYMELGPLFSGWSFNLDKLSHITERLPLLLSKLFAPFTYPSAFSVKDWHLKQDIDDILGDDRWWFRTAGSPDLFLSIRCWIGLFTMLEALEVDIFFRGLWLELTNEMALSIPEVALPKAKLEKVTYDDLAKVLNVQIFQDDIEKVSVSLPSRSLEHIEDLISPDTLYEMKRVGINLDTVVKNQLHKGLRPGVVVDFTEKNRRYLVTLSQ